jgi:uncharacterized protein (DUF2141 family)
MKATARATCVVAGVLCVGAAPPNLEQPLTLGVEGLRSTRGMLQVCLTRLPDHFPDCTGDPDKRHYSVPATQATGVALADLPPGDYAIAIIHDENSNHKLDTFMGIPREGVGFSENPPLHFGPPSFRSARFTVAGSPVRQDVKIKYFL